MLPCRPCSARLRCRSAAFPSVIATSVSEPGPSGLRFAGGTGGSFDILSSMIFMVTLRLKSSFAEPRGFQAPKVRKHALSKLTGKVPICALTLDRCGHTTRPGTPYLGLVVGRGNSCPRDSHHHEN